MANYRNSVLIAYSLKLTGCDLQVVARHASQRTLLEGAHIPCLDEEEIPIRKMDIVIEATGSQAGYVLAGTIEVDFSDVVVDEITLVGSRCGPFAPALRLMETGLVDPRPLINAHYPLREGIAAFERANQPGVFKVVLQP